MSSDCVLLRRVTFSASPFVRITGLCLLFSTCLLSHPAFANVLPPGKIYFDVVPWDDAYDYCATDATSCEQLDPSRPELGAFLFKLFINPPEGYYGEPITSLSIDLYWPAEWRLWDFAFCSGGQGTLDGYGSGPYRLEMTWPCSPVYYEMFPALTLVFYVPEYGILTPDWNPAGALRVGCPPNVNQDWPLYQFAEAGTRCEHQMDPCDDTYPRCAADFPNDVLHLTGETGETVHGELPFTAGEDGDHDCVPSARADEGWARVRVETGTVPWAFTLVVDAKLEGMEPGTYTTDVHITENWMERCVQVIADVEGPSGVESSAGNDPAAPLTLRVTGANPSPEAFELSYESPATAVVRCAVYDAAGREVATILRAEEQSCGPHTLTWDGRDARGDRVMPGVYLIRLSSNGEERSGRVVVVR